MNYEIWARSIRWRTLVRLTTEVLAKTRRWQCSTLNLPFKRRSPAQCRFSVLTEGLDHVLYMNKWNSVKKNQRWSKLAVIMMLRTVALQRVWNTTETRSDSCFSNIVGSLPSRNVQTAPSSPGRPSALTLSKIRGEPRRSPSKLQTTASTAIHRNGTRVNK